MSIIVKPISANLTHDTDLFDDMDPYVEVIIGSQSKRTATRNGAGKNPTWIDTLVFNSKGNTLTVKVWDSDTFSADDLVGEGAMNISNLLSTPNRTQNQYVDLTYKSKSAGRVLLSVEYQGPSIGGNNNNWGNNNNFGPPNNGWGNNNNNGWGNNNNNGWGNNNNGWGNNNNGWGNMQGNSNWGNPGNSNFGNNSQWGANNNGWGNNDGWNYNPNNSYGGPFNQQQNSSWGNSQPQSNWGNNQPQSNWGNPQNNWGNPPPNNWGNPPQQNNWGNNNYNNNGPLVYVIKPIEAQFVNDLDTFSKMDPFLEITIGNNKQRTITQQGAGKYPKFTDTFTFTTNDRLMSVAAYDEDVTTNQLIGQGTLDLSKAANNPGMSQNQYVNLVAYGNPAGRILISIEAKPSNTGFGW